MLSKSQNPEVSFPDDLLSMVAIPIGSFAMGGVADDKFVSEVELPVREISISEPFMLSTAPVTRGQWCEVMGSLPDGNLPGLADDCPVVTVSFADSQSFCREMGEGYRLPSEVEWEYCCRAGSSSVFPSGSNVSTDDANYFYDEMGAVVGKGELLPVRRFPENGFGLFDMIGNVCEWVEDVWHPGFQGAPVSTAAWVVDGISGRRVIRGGGWDHLPRVLRASWRDWAPEGVRWDNLGFRVVKSSTLTSGF